MKKYLLRRSALIFFSACLALLAAPPHALGISIAPLDGTSLASTFETNTVEPLPLLGWTTVSGAARVFDVSNGALISQTQYENYQVQHVTGTLVLPNRSYQLQVKMGFIAGIAGGSADYQLELGTVNGGVFSPLGSKTGTVAYAGNIAFGTVSGTSVLEVTTGPTVSGDPLAVRWAQTGTRGPGYSDHFGIDDVVLSITSITSNREHLDATFGTGGKVVTDFGGNDEGRSVAVQSDGKVLVAGISDSGIALARHTTSGALDTSFGTGGKARLDFGVPVGIRCMALQTDGKIVLAGYSSINSAFFLVRVTAAGALDTSFGSGGAVSTDFGLNDEAFGVAVQGDGKIVAVGTSTNNDFVSRFVLARYTDSGTLDSSFGSGGKVTTDFGVGVRAFGATLQSDGKILVAGNSFANSNFLLGRYTAGGELDTSFGSGGIVSTEFGGFDSAYSVTLQSDGKILVAGARDYPYSTANFALARLLANGTLDSSFGSGGKVVTDFGGRDEIRGVVVQSNGKIVVAGTSSNDFALARYTTSGALDLNFGTGGKLTSDFGGDADAGSSITLQSDGKILVAGHASGNFALARYHTDRPGDLDFTFGTDGSVTTDIAGDLEDQGHSVAVQGDGKILVAGFHGTNFALARYLAGGGLDTSFGTGGKVHTNILGEDRGYSVAVQSDGKILLAGASRITTDDFALVRYTASGALDSSFGNGGIVTTDFGHMEVCKAMVVQSDGKILVIGTNGNGFPDSNFALARYLANGTLDSSFGSGGKVITDFDGRTDQGAGVALQSDGKIVVSGSSGESHGFRFNFALARYNTNGTLDTSFGSGGRVRHDLGGYFGIASGVAIQSDGKILVSGTRRNSFEYSAFALARYTADGALDDSFAGGGIVSTVFSGGPYDHANAVALQRDGRIIVAGDASNGNDHDFALARYLSNGHLDTSFGVGGKVMTSLGSNEHGQAMALVNNGYVVVAGYAWTGASNDFALVRYLVDPAALPAAIGVQQPAGTAIPADSSKDFGSVIVGEQAELTFTLTNTGPGSLYLDASPKVAVSGASAGQFTVTAQPASVVGPGGNTTFTVRFAPTTGGAKSATLSIVSNDENLPIYMLNLVGTGVPTPEIDVQQPAGSSIASGGSRAFGIVMVGTNEERTFTIANTGTGSLALTGSPKVAVGGTDAGHFTVTAQPASPVAVGSSTTFTVRFAPTTGGGKSATLTLANNDLDEGAYTIHLTGTGTAPGDPDAGFGTGGLVTTDFGATYNYANGMVVQGDGKILVVGTSGTETFDIALMRHHADGTLDTSFGTGGKVTTDLGGTYDNGNAVALQSDGKIIVIGTADDVSGSSMVAVRYLANGTLDTTFGTGGKAITLFNGGYDNATCVAVRSDDRIVIAGIAAIGGLNQFAVVRLTGEGALDTSFDTDGKVTTAIGFSNGYAKSIALQSDGKIVVAGYAQNETHDIVLARYTPSGALDNSFGTGGTVNTDLGDYHQQASSVTLQSDGKIVVAASHLEGGTGYLALLRYTTGGELDSSFGTDGAVITTSIGGGPGGVLVQSDGRIVVAGSEVNASNNYDFAVARFESNGAVDTSFGTAGATLVPVGLSDDYGLAAALQSNGKIIVAGWVYVEANTHFGLARMEGGLAAQPEIDLQQPAGASIVSGGSTAFGSVNLGATADLTFTLANTGPGNLNLTGLPKVVVSGPGAGQFTVTAQPYFVLGFGSSTTFTVRFAPATAGPKIATLAIANNDADEASYTITLTGTGLTALDNFRQQYFGSTANSGNGADLFDFDGDLLPNIVEFAFGLDPTQPSSVQLPQAQRSGGYFFYDFNQPAGVNGITYGAEWSTTLLPGSWTPMADSGAAPQHLFALPTGANTRMFMRFKITVP